MSDSNRPIKTTDSAFAVETPEGVRIYFECAGPFVRAGAILLDFLIQGTIGSIISAIILLAFGISFGGEFGMGLILIFIFLIQWFYHVYFEVYRKGQTPGKKWLGLSVLDARGTPVSVGQSILRNLMRTADFMPFGYFFGFLSVVNTNHFQRLGDLVAGTLVVYVPEPAADTTAAANLTPEPPPFPLTLEEQRAIIAFSERKDIIPRALSDELAENLAVLNRAKGRSNRETLYAMAAWLAGGRR